MMTMDQEADLDLAPSVNPFEKSTKKKASRGLYSNIPSQDEDTFSAEDGFPNSENNNAEYKKIMLPMSPSQCQFFMVILFMLGALVAVFFAVDVKPNTSLVAEEDTNAGVELNSKANLCEKLQETKKNSFQFEVVHDPFKLSSSSSSYYSSLFTPPSAMFTNGHEETESQPSLGYLTQPSIHNNTLVFVSEGDIYISSIASKESPSSIPAARLTQTVGNVQTPKINPKYPYLIAYSATYTASRELYLLDLRKDFRSPAQRLTYTPNGIRTVISWSEDGKAILFTFSNQNVGMPSIKIYKIPISTTLDTQSYSTNSLSVGSLQSLPLAQAVDAVTYGTCLYFIRFKQSSHTFRYLGGTAESLWGYCEHQDNAIKLSDYNGTTRSPKIYQNKYLMFISDRSYNYKNEEETPTASTLNLFAVPIPTEEQMYNVNERQVWSNQLPLQITAVSCEQGNDGRQLMEYDIDDETGTIVLRVGADLKILYATEIQNALDKAFSTKMEHGIRMLQKKTNPNPNEIHSNIEARAEETNPSETPVKSDPDNELDHTVDHDHENYKTTNQSLTASTDEVEESERTSGKGKIHTNTLTSVQLNLAVYSDFNLQQERRFSVKLPFILSSFDVFSTIYNQVYGLMGMRGQAFVSPVLSNKPSHPYSGMGQMLPPRGYKLMPSSSMGGITRVLALKHVASSNKLEQPKALILATDPLSETAEHAIYLLPCDSSIKPYFGLEDMPIPILGGHTLSGGAAKDGGLGSVDPDSLEVSPCGRRAAWLDTDGRITIITIPKEGEEIEKLILPQENDRGEPIVGNAALTWSPGGRYLAIEHVARNQFNIISIADLSDPGGEEKKGDIDLDDVSEVAENLERAKEPQLILKKIVQATPSRFNSGDVYWGQSIQTYAVMPDGTQHKSNTLFFLTDRDIVSDVQSPWGTRAPFPHFKKDWVVYALPLDEKMTKDELEDLTEYEIDFEGRLSSPYPNGGASELIPMREVMYLDLMKKIQMMTTVDNSTDSTENLTETASNETEDGPTDVFNAMFTQINSDLDIDFGGDSSLDVFARKAYRISSIPPGPYYTILCQLSDRPSVVVLERSDAGLKVKLFSIDRPEMYTHNADFTALDIEIPDVVVGGGVSTTRDYLYFFLSSNVKVVENSFIGMLSLTQDKEMVEDIVDQSNLIVSVYPKLEYQQMYADAWRMLRDYFYDTNMHGVDWDDVFHRYQPLVARCAKREELDDVLIQMASEVSALHVFVYGGEYEDPTHGNKDMKEVHNVASLGATFLRSEKLGGYAIEEIHLPDPDFAALDKTPIYSPLSEKVMRLSGQKGLKAGDAILSINGESVMGVPDMHMLLRGSAGRSLRLEILRQGKNQTEPVVTVPIDGEKAFDLRYAAWEYRTRQRAMKLAKENGFSCGYIHLRDMDGASSIDAFTRNFFPDYDKQALIIDVRHNNGGNIDSWLLTVLQRKAWSYWQGRVTNTTNGGLGWDEQFAFRGHLVVLVNENTASDGEGFSRGVMELGLGKTVGTRTWGGGIWLSSDNGLVDGGIATAPEIGTYNDNFGWGMGIENIGVEPDVVVDNDPRQVELGNDLQLEKAIEVLKNWLVEEPVVLPKQPGPHPDKSLTTESCTIR